MIIIHQYSALKAGLAGTRAQSCDRYGSDALHPGQVFGGSLPLLSPDIYIYIYLNALTALITYFKHIIQNILLLIINNFNNFRILRLPIHGKFWKYIHSTNIIKFQHNLTQTVYLNLVIIIKTLNDCKWYPIKFDVCTICTSIFKFL